MLPKKSLNTRIKQNYFIVTAFIILVVAAILVRAFYISFVEGNEWQAIGKIRTTMDIPVPAVRGNIYSANYQLMATTESRYRLYIDFWADGVKKDTLQKYLKPLAIELNKMFPNNSAAYYENHIMNGWNKREREAAAKIDARKRNREYRLLDQEVNYIQWVKIQGMPFFKKGRFASGLYNKESTKRTKPYGTLADRTIGDIYADFEKGGKNGLELQYDSLLRGEPGTAIRQRVNGKSMDIPNKKPVNGKDIVSTIDITIQDITEKTLLNKLREINAESGIAVVMDVATGEIKAITNMGRIREGIWGETKNYAVSDLSEPGSTFKVVSMLVALEDGLVHPEDSVNTGNGVMQIAGQPLEDHNARSGGYGMISAAQSIQYSSNIGVAKLIMKAYNDNPSRFVDGIYKTGLNKDLELEIPGYGIARIPHPKDTKQYWDKTALPWMSFGYRTQIPPIYTLTFFNAIANNGKMVKPLFVKEIQQNGKTIEKRKSQVINKQICSSSTLKAIRQMLDDVVNQPKGTGKYAHSDYVRIAGKTGTAQISHGISGYKARGLSHQVSFCGYFPSENPRYSCIVVIRNPRVGGASGGSMCGPVFKGIAEGIYAQNKIPHTNALPVDTIHPFAPRVKSGLTEYVRYTLKKLDVDFKDSLEGKWANAYLQENKLVLKDRKIIENLVPNVVGMGAKDAVYAMEHAGLKVSLSGRGTISNQSIAAGTRIVKGQTVVLQLR
jgi:cell division protein FtsI (penicillin-binding protein 3)